MLSEIASAVGVSTPALFKHYPNKQALVDALLELNPRYVDSQFDAFEALMREFMDDGI